MSLTASLTRIALISFLAVCLPTIAFAELTNCQKQFNKYKRAKGHKAFATTLGNDPGFHPGSCAAVTDFTFKKLAEKKAVEICNRIRRKEDGGKCKVIDSK
jgi:hypothetical protein